MEQVDAVVPTGDGLTEKELRDLIQKQTGITYSRGAVYSALTRGKKAGRYVNNAGRWSRSAAKVV